MRCKEVFCKLRCLRLLSLLEFPGVFCVFSGVFGALAGRRGWGMQLFVTNASRVSYFAF